MHFVDRASPGPLLAVDPVLPMISSSIRIPLWSKPFVVSIKFTWGENFRPRKYFARANRSRYPLDSGSSLEESWFSDFKELWSSDDDWDPKYLHRVIDKLRTFAIPCNLAYFLLVRYSVGSFDGNGKRLGFSPHVHGISFCTFKAMASQTDAPTSRSDASADDVEAKFDKREEEREKKKQERDRRGNARWALFERIV